MADSHDEDWYQWTPANAESPVYEDIARGVREFESLDTAAGRAATAWLKEDALGSEST
ncbi:MAG: hypothetical protein ACRDK4_14930 [Solirubrobacteraceae bacterium]